ncbi:MAG: hypothetical protein KDA69_13865 [Planctomycetaceae bacterium]|nr:hypothetical protein [Planctomycetaceae bacterium]MCA9045408.1 hypothetical protein [Planctomycetaceae bacterium]
MGFDISYHPVDVAFIHDRVLPFVRGQGPIDDLMPDALRIAKVRFRANAWGLGMLRLNHKVHDAQRKALAVASDTRGFFAKLFSKKTVPPRGKTSGIPGFDSEVHVWGRPFFICCDSTEQVSDAIDRYIRADECEVAEIARSMIDYIAKKGVGSDVEGIVGGSLLDCVRPNEDDRLPEDSEIVRGIRWKMDLFREAYAGYREGRKVVDPNGNSHDPRQLFSADFPLSVLEFASHFRPGWMARGYGWPTHLLSKVGVDINGLFSSPLKLFEPLLPEIPEIQENLSDTIHENYMVGGFVDSDKVPELLDSIERHSNAINEWAQSEGWGDDGAATYLSGIREAVSDAARRGLAFAEATEAYSAPMGQMN